MIRRRDLLIGTACLAAAGTAEAIRPRGRMSLVGGAKLEQAIPLNFGPWRNSEASGLVTPESEDSLAAQLYSQIVGRLYERSDGGYVMMLIAYGDTQSDLLQLHRPEVCYPAFGFQVTDSAPTALSIGEGVQIPGRRLTATADNRVEHISYWTRIGEYLPVDNRQQRLDKLRTAMSGLIPDGVLVRLSSSLEDRDASFALNETFATDLLRATRPTARAALITTDKARALSQRLAHA